VWRYAAGLPIAQSPTGRARAGASAFSATPLGHDRNLGYCASVTADGCPRCLFGAALRQAEIRRLALALRQARRQLKANHDQLRTIVDDLAPGLTDRYGVGPVTAAQAVVSFSHPGRCRNEAAFAALAGTSPLPASSGRTAPLHSLLADAARFARHSPGDR
jgi:transposase